MDLELGNVLIQTERQKRITNAQISTHLELISRLPMETDTTYNAAYLAFAIRPDLPLATQDKTLIRTANRFQSQTLPKNL